MRVKHHDKALAQMERELAFTAGRPLAVVRAYRKQMQLIRMAKDERDIRAIPGNHFEKLSGKRSSQRSLRLNKRWRLIIEIEQRDSGPTVHVVTIEDHYQ